MKSDNQYLFAYETLMNVQGNLRRSGKFKTYKSFLENSDRAYVNSLNLNYLLHLYSLKLIIPKFSNLLS